MDLIFYVLIALIIIGCSLVILYLVLYNRMQILKIKVDEAETIIDDTLRIRFDLMSRLNGFIKDEDKQKYFKDFENLKSKKISNFDLDRKITEAMIMFEQMKYDSKELSEDKNIKAIEEEMKESEEKLEAAKSYFNLNISKLNARIKTFPSSIIAKMHGIKIKPYYDGKDLHDEDVDDFKL